MRPRGETDIMRDVSVNIKGPSNCIEAVPEEAWTNVSGSLAESLKNLARSIKVWKVPPLVSSVGPRRRQYYCGDRDRPQTIHLSIRDRGCVVQPRAPRYVF
jgi:hypothetical protein